MHAIFFIVVTVCNGANCTDMAFEDQVYKSRQDCMEAKRELNRELSPAQRKYTTLKCDTELRRDDR